MVHLKSAEEVQIIKESAQILGKAHGEIAKHVKPGVRTQDLDKLAEEFIRDNGGTPSFKNYNGFPAALCISVNEVVVHGFPGTYEIRDADIISIDCGVYFKGYHSDSAYTYPLEGASAENLLLLNRTYESLYRGIEQAKAGNRIGDVSSAIQTYVEGFGYGVVRELVGHGLGQSMHEDPQVPNYGKRGSGKKLKAGMVLAIEPMINMGKKDVFTESDGWTIRTKDGKPSVHFEHDVCVRKDKADILSNYEPIEEAEKNNPNLFVCG
jgi:methionyl aminopeptidase